MPSAQVHIIEIDKGPACVLIIATVVHTLCYHRLVLDYKVVKSWLAAATDLSGLYSETFGGPVGEPELPMPEGEKRRWESRIADSVGPFATALRERAGDLAEAAVSSARRRSDPAAEPEPTFLERAFAFLGWTVA